MAANPQPAKPVLGGEPAAIIGALVSIIVALGAIFHVVIDVNTVTAIIVAAAPLVSALLIRFNVHPVVK